MLMEDGRLARNYDSVRKAVDGRVAWLEAIPEYIWRRMAEPLSNTSLGELRDAALSGAHTSLC
jgi:hypothetical protein